MHILLNTFNLNNTQRNTFRDERNKFGQVNFCALKKSSFEGFDLECVNRFKAPIETFNSKEDFFSWVKKFLEQKFTLQQYKNHNETDTKERFDILWKWREYLTNDNNLYNRNSSLSLIIIDGITRMLTPKNREVPPILNPAVLSETVKQIGESALNKKGNFFNFDKIYRENLRKFITSDIETETGEVGTKWVKIPSKIHDETDFDLNVEKLKALSCRSWCTKSTHARPYLSEGDFYIFIENGKPKASIRIAKDMIEEIQGEKNNSVIPSGYVDEIDDFIKSNNLDAKKMNTKIQEAKSTKIRVKELKTKLAAAIRNNDRIRIFEEFNIRAKFDEQGRLVLSHYSQPDKLFSYDDLGINENELLKGLVRIEKDADFSYSKAYDLSTLEYIGRSANFGHSAVKNLGALKYTGGDLKLSNSRVNDLHSLETIGYNVWLRDCGDIRFDSLKEVGGDLYLENSKIKIMPRLTNVKGEIHTRDCDVELPLLKR